MTEREKYLLAKIASLEAENRRLFHFETAVLQIRNILSAYLLPNRGVALRDGVVDIISIIEAAGFPLRGNDICAGDQAPVPSDAKILPFPSWPRSLREH